MNGEKDNQLSWSNRSAEPQPKPLTPAPEYVHKERRTIPAAKLAGWMAVGIVAGVILAWSINSVIKRGSVTNNAPVVTPTATTTEGQGSDASFSVMTPQKAGRSVAVRAVVQTPTWVVVYESRNGTPGNVLGASLFFPERSTGTVELLRGTTAGQTYFVTKHRDNGDRRFSLHSDALLEEGGQAVWTTFTAN